ISREHLDLENWGLSSEVYRGLLAGGVQYDCHLDFRHVSEESDVAAWRNLAAELHGYDGVVFIGQQLSGLQQLLTHCLPVFQGELVLPGVMSRLLAWQAGGLWQQPCAGSNSTTAKEPCKN
ncbi:MAG: hypothetical protein GX937_11655, partial [Lentisphaerae bacterium]|nr:hypothetical protein [Lentisphaerota bacterium]